MSVTEFESLNPDQFHLVGDAATGFPVLMAKAAEMVEDEAEKAKLRAKERDALDDSDFAFPEQRKEPLHDEAHVRNAISRFGQVEGAGADDKRKAAHRIMSRAKELGIDVADDSDVAQAAKETASPDASLAQTRTVDAGPEGAEPSPECEDGGEPRHVEFPHNGESDGGGDTASDKDTHQAEAEGQTNDNIEGNPAAKADGADPDDDSAPDDDDAPDDEDGAKKDSPGGEQQDVALGEKAERLVSQLAAVVHTFTEREKAEGGASKELRRVVRGIQYVATRPELLKEMADMPNDELVKALDELGKARRDAEKAAKKEARKAEEKAAKAAEEAAKAAAPAEQDDVLAKALGDLNTLREQVEKLAASDGRRVVTDPTGLATILRSPGPERDNVYKALDDDVETARKASDTAQTELEKMRAEQALRSALQKRAAAKLVAADNGRANGSLPRGRFGPNSAELFTNTHSIGEDTGLRYAATR